MNQQKKINSLYIHIPFCSHLCAYCDFTKLIYNEKFASNYLESVFFELDSYNIDKVKTLYIGGGTPTSLNDHDFELLLKKASSYLDIDYEFSVEANVENLTDNKLAIMKKYHVNRISIGVQSSNDVVLQNYNRHHCFNDAKKVINKVKQYGFNNINVDLIYGYEGQTLTDLDNDLNNFLSLDVPHISIYSLTINKGTMFYNNHYQEQNQDDSRLFYDHILNKLRKSGYSRYEISNYCKPGYESKHNLTYWKNEQYYGIGLGASGYINNIRYTNTKNLNKYINHQFIDEKEIVDQNDLFEYFLLTNLRLEKGFSRLRFKEIFNYDLYEAKKDIFDEMIKKRLIQVDENIHLLDEGLIIMDSMILKLID